VSVPFTAQTNLVQRVSDAQRVSRRAGPGDAVTSWMSPSVTAQALLYVLDNTYVTVYSYPQGKLEGRLRHFYLADDACVDTKGDVFIVNLGYGRVFEYAHGGTKRLEDLDIRRGRLLDRRSERQSSRRWG